MVWAWQFAFGLLLASLFYSRQYSSWALTHARHRLFGYILASIYAFAAVLLLDLTFRGSPLPRFDDIFIAGIALAAYLFGTGPAAYLLVMGLAVSVWVSPPVGSFYVADPADLYRLASFASVSMLLMFVIARLKHRAAQKLSFPLGYVFATAYAAIALVTTLVMSHSQVIPRFMDIFLVGIAVTAYFFTISPATYLLAISVAISAWILPPSGSFAIANPLDWYRIFSFTAVAALLIFLTDRLKRWSAHTTGALDRR